MRRSIVFWERTPPPIHRESWHRMKGWYWAAVERAPPPARVALKQITAELVDLYRHVPPQGIISPYLLSHYRWRTRYPQRTRYIGQ